MDFSERKSRHRRLEPHLPFLRKFQEPRATNKASLVLLMKDLKDEGNTLFKEDHFKEAGLFYSYALIVGRQLERTFYHAVEREFLAVLYCNASLCSLRIEDYKEALKDAEAALNFQPENIKAMYRRASALEGLGRLREALDQALKGRDMDNKNNFDELIDGLNAKLFTPVGPAKVNRGEPNHKIKASDKASKKSPAGDDWMQSSAAEKKKEQAKEMNSKKKKKGQSQSQQQQQKSLKKKQAEQKPSLQAQEDSDRDSDSTISDDDEFAKRMTSVQGSANVKPQKAGHKNAAPAPAFSNHAGAGSGQPAQFTSVSQGTSAGNMGLDNFTLGKHTTSKATKTTKPVFRDSNPAMKPSIQWPLEQFEFRLVCKVCFVKEKEGIGGCNYRANYPHSCSHDVLIVRGKNNPNLNWLKIRPRLVINGQAHTFAYKLCISFQNGQPCRLGEAKCTFAHSPAEISFWNLDREETFNIHNFMRDAKQKGIFSSDALKTSSEPSLEKYIPGMPSGKPGATHNTTGSSSAAVPPASSQPTSGFQQRSQPQQQQQQQQQPVIWSQQYVSSASQESRTHQSPFSVPPPSLPTSKSTSHPTNPSTFKQFSPPVFKQPAPSRTQQIPNTPLPSQNQAAPCVSNPFPQLEYRLLCPTCLVFTGQPWLYFYNPPNSHQCLQSILAYKVKDESVWVQIRERASHRNFKGNYVMCHSVTGCNPDICKFRENCSFAHSTVEQALWKLEQEGRFDIGEFVLWSKRSSSHDTLGRGNNEIVSAGVRSSSGMYVRDLLEKFEGYFRFICRDCFFAQRPMISGMHSNGKTCLGSSSHMWQTARIIAHVKDTAYTPVDERKFVHEGAFYLMCNYQQFCQNWYSNRCRYAHSQVEKAVWMLERDTKITRDELVQQSASLFTAKQTMSAPPPTQASGGAMSQAKVYMPQVQAQGPQVSGQAWSQTQSHTQGQAKAKSTVNVPSVNVTEYCRTCWGKGQRSEEDKGRDKCVRGHNNFKLNSAFVSLPTVKEIRSLPATLSAGMKLVLCEYHPKCTRRVCSHPHGEEEMEVWGWMLRNNVKTLREVCDRCTAAQKQKTRTIDKGESVISVASSQKHVQAKSLNQIIAPGDLHIHEHYCQYCGTSCNSDRQWDEHCMSERHINNVNSDREHQWNFRQPPWTQGSNLELCAKHLHNKSCQYSYFPDMYNMCGYAHSQEELDEWRERYDWRQMKRTVARDRNMSSYTEALLDEYHSQGNSVNVISESIQGVAIICNEEQILYRVEKNDIFTWMFQIHTKKTLEKVALLHNKDRLHFKLLSSTGAHHQMTSGDAFLDVDSKGKACYKIKVHFNGGMFGSFSQWVVFDFGSRPVLVKKLSVEIGDQLQHDRVKELREELTFDRWTTQNREIVRFSGDQTPDQFTDQLLNRYKEPSASEDVVTSHRLTELNQHNYIHKMHGLLELEEITRQAIIASYNLSCTVTLSQTLQEPGMFLIGTNGDLFIKVNLTEHLTQDTLPGKLVLSCVRTALLARAGSSSNRVYEASLVGENNYGYDGRGKEYIYLVISAETAKALGVSQGQTVKMDLQFQMDRRFFCRMHYALDSLRSTDVVFPDVVKFKPDINELNALTKIRSNVLNDDQMVAVRHIVVQREGYTPPFVMYGPFGTGKTETLAQATMTLLRERKDKCRILICTQSNSAADLYITKHLHAFISKGGGKNLKILRLNAEERRHNTVPEEVLGFCHSTDKKTFKIPTKAELQSYHLVLTTVENSLVLSSLDMHSAFTHIFVDEAGQTLETEILMSLCLATTKTCVVLTGDHHQISPTVYSQEARRQNFGVSILVRLFNYYDNIANCGINAVSDRCQKSPLNIFLSINYRTKTEILRFISSVFYGGPDSLKAFGKIPAVMGITPLMFYAVQGRESQNADSTSYLNHAEAQEVVARVTELLENWPAEWGPKDPKQVAVISTYHDQVKHVRKILRQDKKHPYLSHVDVGPINSFQGKEVRALFITAVRTSNLLREPHIIRSLEANEDIGDLGFMSNPKLLNTALTRTQSFVAVIGDPIALCVIGECTQIWRTYLKHCSNMSSVRPMSYTYDAIKNMALQVYLGSEGRVIEMISKRGQESFKHLLNTRKAAKPVMDNVSKAVEDIHIEGGGDADTDDLPVERETSQPVVGVTNSSGDGQTIWQPSGSPSVKTNKPHQLSHQRDELSANTATISEDILFQLARESLGGSVVAQNSDIIAIKSEGISLDLEKDNLAVLSYSPNGKSQEGHEPFRIMTEDDDFVAFTVFNEDTEVEETYENWSKDKLWAVLDSEPQRFFKCSLAVKSRDVAFATVLGPLTAHIAQMVGKDIEIKGSLSRGHALNGDTVVVEILRYSDNVMQGQVKGILDRAQDPSSRLYVCTADSEIPGILTPINCAMPRIYAITSAPHVALARKGYICVYSFGSKNCIEFSNYEKVDPSRPDNLLFIVRYLCWQPDFLLPCGVVVGVIKQNYSLEQGLKMLDVEHNLQTSLPPQALEEAESIFPPGSSVPADLMENRRDLTQTYCFTVGDGHTQDLELAVSVMQTGNVYEVGLHATDVSAFVDKDCVLDQGCEHLGASVFPLGKEPRHMLPLQAATNLCSLRPGLNRLALSVIIRVDEEGKPSGEPEVLRSVISSKRHFSHSEVEDILLSPEDAQGDYLMSCIIVLYQLAFLWRGERLGNGQFYPGLEPEKRLMQHSYLMMNEVKLQFNGIVANLLLTAFPETIPLQIQSFPQREKLENWKRENAVFAMHSIPMTRAFLEDRSCVPSQVCRCATACTCVFSYLRQHRLENVDHLAIFKESWLIICQAVSEDYHDFDLAQELIASPEHMPQLWLAAHRLAAIQQPQVYNCSAHLPSPQDRQHYGLCLQAATNFTSPLRSFISLVVQRMLAAYIDGASSPYNSAEMGDLCGAATATEQQVDSFHSDLFVLHISSALQAQPLVISAVVAGVDSQALELCLGPGLKGLSNQRLDLHLLSPARVAADPGAGVQLQWQERVYEHAGSSTQAQYSVAVKLDPDRLVCNIPSIPWQRLLIAVREKNDASLAACVQEISRHVGGEMELRSKSQCEIVSDQARHYVPFSLTVREGQSLSVQLTAKPCQGRLSPCIQLVQLTPCLALCVEHRMAPEDCFACPALATHAQVTYVDEVKYATNWLLPTFALESAHQAVEKGERVTIHSVSIDWSVVEGLSGRQEESGSGITGTFFLSREFCERSCFNPETESIVASTFPNEKSPNCDDASFCLAYLCVRYSGLSVAGEPGLDETVAAVVNNSQPVTWVGHCRVTQVTGSAHGFQVKVALVQSSMKIPTDLLGKEGTSALCTVEWICKTNEHRVIEATARSLAHASSFVKDIITGRKPLNTIDPVPQDNSVMMNSSVLHTDQEAIISDCYRNPFVAVVGGPGTGKSIMAARLAHLLARRNKTTDTFRQIQPDDGTHSQLMICSPTEKSLDVITGYLLGLNFTNISMVRVYNEEVEERDFPTSLVPKPNMAGRQSPCAVMEDLALHHLIRRGDSPEVKDLLEQEMLLTMYGGQVSMALRTSMERAQWRELSRAQIILCTPLTSARPIVRSATNIRQIIMDDASLIPEIEAIVPLVVHRNVNQLLMFGDPKMPWKEMSSGLASQLGLSRPLLQRYTEGARLLGTQFRTTEAMSSFPSSYFYEDSLSTLPTQRLRAAAPSIPWPGQAGMTCVFCHIQGEESRLELEGVATSSAGGLANGAAINRLEAEVVFALVEALTLHHQVEESSILVITSTNAQATLLKQTTPHNVDICTVLESVGRECDYVILSTVRSLPSEAVERPASSKWTREHVGSMADAGLVNMAITRARAALFIVGNKDLLGSCEPWQSLLASYRHHGCLQTNTQLFLESLKTF